MLNVKYEKEMQGCFGVEIKVDEDGCERGVRITITSFNYTEKKILSKMETDKMIHTEIASVKRLNRSNPKWVKDERIAGILYLNDSVDKIEGVGKIAKQRLNSNGIYTVGDLHGLHSKERLIVEIAKRTKGLPVASIKRFLDNCKHLSHVDAPTIVYYRDDENPYAAKFGSKKGMGRASMDS